MTERQKDVLEFIVKFKQTNGYSPTVREISKGVYTSVSYVHTILCELQDMKYIRFSHGKQRTIVVLKFE